ncbi:hypothetical protein A3K63_01350 [Candidatus Micrarchaeota archaeon RBG_16_49_10]|nr:MAG: hypothetical protein A3K63_01350 [Candidatus Micrarchaeota archaeon RBG_16_49_10]
MSKGEKATDTTFNIILGIIILVVVSVLAFTSLSKGNIRNILCPILPFTCETKPNAHASGLTNAIKCANYRCFDDFGCNVPDSILEDLSWQLDGKTVTCKDFCSSAWMSDIIENPGAICNHDASQYPVEITIGSEGATVTQSDFADYFDCFVDEQTVFEKSVSTESLILLNMSYVSTVSERAKECKEFDKIKNSPTVFNIESNKKLYIRAEIVDKGGLGITLRIYNYTVLDKEPLYAKLTPGVPLEIPFKYIEKEDEPNPKQRIVVIKDGQKISDIWVRISKNPEPSGGNYLPFLTFDCNRNYNDREDKAVCVSGNIFCDSYLARLSKIEDEGGGNYKISVTLTFIDPECNSRGTNICSPACNPCNKEFYGGTSFTRMCCYLENQACSPATGLCEGLKEEDIKPECETSNKEYCPNNCEVCKRGTEAIMCCNKGQCDASTGLCTSVKTINEDLTFSTNLDTPHTIYITKNGGKIIERVCMHQIKLDPSSQEILEFNIFHNCVETWTAYSTLGDEYEVNKNLKLIYNGYEELQGSYLKNVHLTASYWSAKCDEGCQITIEETPGIC